MKGVGGVSGVVRDKALVIRVTAAELEALHAGARGRGRGKTASWAREVLLAQADADADGGPGAESGAGVDVGARAAVVNAARGELVRLGNNLNQVARAVNVEMRRGGLSQARLSEAVEVIAGARAGLARVRDELRDGGERG